MTACHQSSAPSVRIVTSPPGVRSYLVIADSGGEYACTLTATEPAEEFRTSCTCRGPKDRTSPAGTGLAAERPAPRDHVLVQLAPHHSERPVGATVVVEPGRLAGQPAD